MRPGINFVHYLGSARLKCSLHRRHFKSGFLRGLFPSLPRKCNSFRQKKKGRCKCNMKERKDEKWLWNKEK